MVFRKNNCQRIIVGTGLLALFLMTSCKKLKTKDPIVFSVSAFVPYSSTPVPGVTFTIREFKKKGGFAGVGGYKEEPTGWELKGVTGSDGKAKGSFLGVLKSNYSYKINFDYSNLALPMGYTDYIIQGPQYDQLSRSNPNENNYEIRILAYTSMHFKIENVNCFGSSDQMRYKVYNCDETPNQDFQYMPWSNNFNGCGIMCEATSNHVLAGHQLFKLEIIRNNDTTTYVDTFLLKPGLLNNVFVEY